MAYEMKDNSGSIFKNKNKTEDWHAPMRGNALIGGVEYWVDAYTNVGTKNDDQERWQGLRFKPKDNQQATSSNATNNANNEITEDDIPF
ncbi:MAG TPA: hypothetical protein DEO86_11215 [Colwellia sp.]|nr:hypothetical protein [Colwellia sp.]|tara:strand:+ start:643 stop:909 length:267 start_codon:yes stop_codon:yes gene_type:complete